VEEIAAWVGNIVTEPIGPGLLGFLLLLFPNGRPPSPRWRKVVWFHATAVALLVLRQALSPGPLDVYGFVENPFGVEALRGALTAVEAPIFVLLLASLLASALSVVMRFRRSAGEERQQIKWLASSGTLLVVTFALGPVIWSVPALEGTFWSLLFLLVSSTIPLSVGAAVLRYRLYDIDLIINRTLVYGTLTATLALIYLGSVVGLQYVLRTLTGQESQLAIVASTLAIAALFNPLRRRIQAFIDRRFYRRKYDAVKTLEAFSVRVRKSTDLDALSGDLIAVAQETVQPEHVSLWLHRRVGLGSRKGEADCEKISGRGLS
jgi:hypothetical protein